MSEAKKEIYTDFTKDLTCPYCGHEQNAAPEDYRDDDFTPPFDECKNCQKKFQFSLDLEPVWWSSKLPCANGQGEHSFFDGACTDCQQKQEQSDERN